MNARILWRLGLVATLCLSIVGVAAAAPFIAPSADIYIDSLQPSTALGQTDSLSLWTQLNGDASGEPGNCVVSQIALLQFDLSGLPEGQQLGTLTNLVLTRKAVLSNNASYRIALYQTTSDSWGESSTWNSVAGAALVGSQIQIVDIPATNGTQAVFSGDALRTYVQAQADGDNVVSFAVQLISNTNTCSSGATNVIFNSANQGGGTVPALNLRGPNAVELTTLTAEQPAPNWPLYIGLGVLALVIGGLLFYRRRASATR